MGIYNLVAGQGMESPTNIPVISSALIVAGGGGGGGVNGSGGGGGDEGGGGGGGGGVGYGTLILNANSCYSVVVGAGGLGDTTVSTSSSGQSGSNTSFIGGNFSEIAYGGGGGGTGNGGGTNRIGLNGGSGGGGNGWNTNGPGGNTISGGIGTLTYYGNAGNTGFNQSFGGGGGGGGGAGGFGFSNSTGSGGAGGAGVAFNIANGSFAYYGAGGGGGANYNSGTIGGAGGPGINAPGNGGYGGNYHFSGNSGVGYGMGGGGAAGGALSTTYYGANGTNGVIIISYPGNPVFSGGLITTNGSNTVHTFNTPALFTGSTTQTDIYQPYNTLLVHGDGINGANNMVFLDNSPLNSPLYATYYLNDKILMCQGSFSPFSTTGWSNYFNGSTDYFLFPSSASALYISGAFTWEAWVYPTSSQTSIFYGNYFNSGSNNNFAIFWVPSGFNGLYLYFYQGQYGTNQSAIGTTANNITLNAWNHIAISRDSSNNWYIFINGVSQTLNTYAQNQTWNPAVNFSSPDQVGVGGNSAYKFAGYISNMRYTKSALYTSNFTPPTSPLTSATFTTLLTCQSNIFVDSSSSLTITISGSPQVQPFSPFNFTSAYSNSVGGSLSISYLDNLYNTSNNANIALGTGDFTIEAWLYSSNTQGIDASIYNSGNGGPGTLTFHANNTSTDFQRVISATIQPYAWNHIAVTRSGNTVGNLKLFVNGNLANTSNVAYNYNFTQGNITIGSSINGSLSNLRVIKGNALYTSSFNVPTSPLLPTANTVLFINANNAGVIDNTQKNNLFTYGAAAISTAQSKFGGSSIYLDANSYVSSTHNPLLDLSTGAPNFTVECWIYPFSTSNGRTAQILTKDWPYGGPNPSYGMYLTGTSGQMIFVVADATNVSSITQYTYNGISANTWTHLALVRKANNMLSFVNGNLVNTSLITITTKDSGTYFNIGTGFSGYIDEVRITKGVARYTSSFTPSSFAFPNT
jgi:Concanavalin A-like lectin/glucanases superfamily